MRRSLVLLPFVTLAIRSRETPRRAGRRKGHPILARISEGESPGCLPSVTHAPTGRHARVRAQGCRRRHRPRNARRRSGRSGQSGASARDRGGDAQPDRTARTIRRPAGPRVADPLADEVEPVPPRKRRHAPARSSMPARSCATGAASIGRPRRSGSPRTSGRAAPPPIDRRMAAPGPPLGIGAQYLRTSGSAGGAGGGALKV